MVKVIIGEEEYDTDQFTDIQKQDLEMLHYNDTLMKQMQHQLKCMSAVGKIKFLALKESLNNKGDDNADTEKV